ncbi:phosphoesterase PA-phosphatase-like protein [Halosimplex carlsbadense 2-9-1]|uniref:Phosphoesterase PA-phosphatase-like protein n=1 Tax=Halosimplex carlsbadense 2-9-1 TaxID=797114 RepID=M0CNS4_9EURY|nr:phosphatase PAP2 family protein [Halosimplex carlsbadense]ELZ24925.1 phosphoesterase PA-phosphatase-like protein [Halosimplex carlsbadense 2-9-1]
MFRLVAASEAIRRSVPDELVPVFGVLTVLGSAKFLMVALSLAYWNDQSRRRELLTVVGVAFVAVSLTLALKYWFGLPRPPAAVRRIAADPSPVGFPSGHAIAATTVYGGTLVALDRYRDPKLLAGAGVLVTLVGLSRVVVGVHYLGDVLAGFAVGLAMVGVVAVALDRGPSVVFGLAVVCAVPAVILTTDPGDAALAGGGSIGGLAGSLWRTRAERFRSRVERAAVTVGGVAFVAVAIAVVETVEPALVPTAVANAGLVVGIVALPALVGRFDGFGSASAAD